VLSARASDDNKLPNMKLLEFNGDYDKFIPYWDTFHSMVDSKKILNVQKLNHLVNTLKGPAASFIAGYQMTGDNYELIVDKLKQKYGQRRVVVSKILRALLFRPQCTSMKQVRETVDFLQASVRQLDREQIRHEDPALQLVLLSVLEVKLPSEMLLKWTEYVTREEVKLNLEAPRLPKAVACAPLRNHITVKQFLAGARANFSVRSSALPLNARVAPPPRAAATAGSPINRLPPRGAAGHLPARQSNKTHRNPHLRPRARSARARGLRRPRHSSLTAEARAAEVAGSRLSSSTAARSRRSSSSALPWSATRPAASGMAETIPPRAATRPPRWSTGSVGNASGTASVWSRTR